MFNIEKDINWELFGEGEKEQIINCYEHDEWNKLCCLPGVKIDSPAKEKEIEKIVIEMREIDITDESVVRDDLEKFWAKGEQIDTPEKEAKWQKKIDKENEEKKAILKEEEKSDDAPIEEPKIEEKPVEDKKVEETKEVNK